MSEQQKDILNALIRLGGKATTREIADYIELGSPDIARTQLHRMQTRHWVGKKGEHWIITNLGQAAVAPPPETGVTISDEEYGEIQNLVSEFFKEHKETLAVSQDKIIIDYGAIDLIDDSGMITECVERHPAQFERALIDTFRSGMQIKEFAKPFISYINIPDFLAIPIHAVREERLGDLVQVRGEIISHSQVQVAVIRGVFECRRCHALISNYSRTGNVEPPLECHKDQGGCGRSRGGTLFVFMPEPSVTKSYQRIRIQEYEGVTHQANRPQIDVYLDDPLVDVIEPDRRIYEDGNVIKVVGIVSMQTKTHRDRTEKVELFLDARSTSVIIQSLTDREPFEDEIAEITKLAQRPDVMELLTDCICTELEGYRALKKLTLLTFFYGSTKTLPDGLRVRKSPNILLLGDLSTGKSVLLHWIAAFYPKSHIAVGRGGTPAGLFGMALRDDLHGGWFTYLAGMVPRSHNGIACIDEVEKHLEVCGESQFLEQMESRFITINKGTIRDLRLEADCPIVAAANWRGVRYDDKLDVYEQVPKSIPPTFLSRCILVNMDKLKEGIDAGKMQDRIIAKHSGNNGGDEIAPPISYDTLRSWICYARKNIDPNIKSNPGVVDKIKEVYSLMEFRTKESDSAMSPRLFEDLIRLTESSARIHLRNVPTLEDVEHAASCINLFVCQWGTDPHTGKFDGQAMDRGGYASQISLALRVRETISHHPSGITLIEIAERLGEKFDGIERILSKLKEDGEIYEQSSGLYKRVG